MVLCSPCEAKRIVIRTITYQSFSLCDAQPNVLSALDSGKMYVASKATDNFMAWLCQRQLLNWEDASVQRRALVFTDDEATAGLGARMMR